MNDAGRIVLESPYYVAKYRDGDGIIRERGTGCKDKQAAERKLSQLERQAELIRVGVMTTDEADTAKHSAVPLTRHVEAFGEHLRGKQVAEMYHYNTLRHIRIVADECGFSSLTDMRREPFERWLLAKVKSGLSPRTP
jgi:hypothetical protein